MIDLTFNNQTKGRHFGRRFFLDIFSRVVSILKLEGENLGLSLNLVGETEIKLLNKKYRRENRATDVLSFPLKYDALSKFAANGAIIELGDIFICLPIAQKKAETGNTSLKRELALLAIHGFLHLAGYDHEKSPATEKEMSVIQNKILGRLANID